MVKKLITNLLLSLLICASINAEAKNKQESTSKSKNESINVVKYYNGLKTEKEKADFKNEFVKEVSDQISTNLPYKVNDKISWEKIEGKDSTLIYTYKIDEESVAKITEEELQKYFHFYMKDKFDQIMCKSDMLKGMLKIGIKVEISFVDFEWQKIPVNMTFTEKDCN